MKSWLCRLGVAMLAGCLGVSGAANATGVVETTYASMAIDSAGKVFTWGGGMGMGGLIGRSSTTPTAIGGISPVVSVSRSGSFAVLKDGTLFDVSSYSPVAGVSGVREVISNGSTFNYNYYNSTAPSWFTFAKSPGVIGAKAFVNVNNGMGTQAYISGGIGLSGVGVAKIVPRSNPAMNSTSWAWGIGSDGQLYDAQSLYDPGGMPVYAAPVTGTCTATGPRAYTTAVVAPYSSTFYPGNQFSFVQTIQDPVTLAWSCADTWLNPITTLTEWQGAYLGVTTTGISNIVVPVSGVSNVVDIAEDYSGNNFVVRSDGTVWAWGAGIGANGAFNPFMGGGPVAGVSGVSAVQVAGIANVVSVKANGLNVYALTTTGQVYAWGNDAYGQLGQGYGNWGMQQALPVLVPGLNNIVALHELNGSVLALDASGNVWAWGDNYWGQLGLGNNIGTPEPTQIPGLSGVTSLNVMMSSMFGGITAVATKADGSVWAWGDNSGGALGNGTLVSSNVPVRVLGQFGVGFLNADPAVLDVLVGGVSILNSNVWNGFNFGNQAVGTTSAPQSMTIVNTGLIAWTGYTAPASVGDFSSSNNCGTSLLPGASCTVNFTFTPTLAGLRSATTGSGGFGNGSIGGGGGIPLSGTGVAPQAVMSTALGFGTQKTAISTTKVVTLSNAGNAALTIGTPGVTGAGFTLGTATCGATLAAGASCTLNVNFLPVAAAAYTGSLTFTGSNNPGGAPVMALSGAGAVVAAVRGDFDGNGMADILWRNQANGQNAIWFINGTVLTSAAYAPTVAVDWTAVGVADFNGDRKADILWSNLTTGQNAIWTMNAQNILTGTLLNSVATGWAVAGTGDFDGDGKSGDILWMNAQTRQIAVWLTNASGQVTSAALLGTIAPGWSIAGLGDFNGDGKRDILWRNTTTGTNAMWFLNGAAIGSTAVVQTVPATWTITGTGDLNGDGKTDILWRDAGGRYAVWFMNGGVFTSSGYIAIAPPIVWTSAKLVDFNGDGKDDIMWRDTTGLTAVWLMNGVTISGSAVLGTVPTTFTAVDK